MISLCSPSIEPDHGVCANAPFFFNTIRKGSIATDERVFDPATGQALKWEVVGGAQARREGHPDAALDTEYIKVYLARPVPPQGQARVVIDKTYDNYDPYLDGMNYLLEGVVGSIT